MRTKREHLKVEIAIEPQNDLLGYIGILEKYRLIVGLFSTLE